MTREMPRHADGGEPSRGDPEVHLHSELGEEAKRLATHPREEAHPRPTQGARHHHLH